MLSVENLSKKYGNVEIISNVNLKFENGNFYIFTGINGSGKSTITKIIAGLIYKTSGTLKIEDSISYLPDKYIMPKLLRVKSYCKILSIPLEYISKYQIPNRRIGELSKGNFQKLGIIQILSRDTDCYIFDEPLDGLDDVTKRIFKQDIINKINDNKIIIMCLHTKALFNELHPIIYEIKEGFINEKKKKAAIVTD